MQADNLAQFTQLLADVVDLGAGVGIEENFGQQVVVFSQQAFGNGHVFLERGTGGILRLHDAGESKGGYKWYGERVGDGFIVFGKGVLVDIEMKAAVQVAEECLSVRIRLADDDGIVAAQVAQVGEGRTEHRVGRNEGMAAGCIKLGQAGLYGSDVAEHTMVAQVGQHFLENGQGMADGNGIQHQVGLESAYLIVGGKPTYVEAIAQFFRLGVIDGHIVVEAQGIGKEHTHLAAS